MTTDNQWTSSIVTQVHNSMSGIIGYHENPQQLLSQSQVFNNTGCVAYVGLTGSKVRCYFFLWFRCCPTEFLHNIGLENTVSFAFNFSVNWRLFFWSPYCRRCKMFAFSRYFSFSFFVGKPVIGVTTRQRSDVLEMFYKIQSVYLVSWNWILWL